MVWMRAKDATIPCYQWNISPIPGEENEGIPPVTRIYWKLLSLNTFKQFYENSNIYYDWIEDTDALHELLGRYFSYKPKDTIVQYCVERMKTIIKTVLTT